MKDHMKSKIIRKGYKGMAMEGFIAKWYAKITKNSEDHKLVAKRVTEYIVEGSCVLEVAPGPGYLAIELAKLGYKVTGLDISKTFVEIGIEEEVKKMNLNRINSLITKWIFKHMLIKRAYSKVQIKEFVSKTNFRKCNIKEEPIGLDILLEK